MKFSEEQKQLIEETKQKLPKSQLVKEQRRIITTDLQNGEKLIVTLRYDDSCGNGHNTFSITGEIYDEDHTYLAGGCIHEEIAKWLPHLKKYLKWHLTSSDGPMHYYANSLYFASDKDPFGNRKGAPIGWQNFVCFECAEDREVCLPISSSTSKFLDKAAYSETYPLTFAVTSAEQASVSYKEKPDTPPSTYYTIESIDRHGRVVDRELNQFGLYDYTEQDLPKLNNLVDLLNTYPYTFKKEANRWSEGKEPELENARAAAVWPEANLEDFTVENLAARLPALMEEFKRDMEELGFDY